MRRRRKRDDGGPPGFFTEQLEFQRKQRLLFERFRVANGREAQSMDELDNWLLTDAGKKAATQEYGGKQ